MSSSDRTPGVLAQRRIWARLTHATGPRSLRAKRVHCVICHTYVGPDDAIGLVPEGITHAECAVIHMLTQPSSSTPTKRPEKGRRRTISLPTRRCG